MTSASFRSQRTNVIYLSTIREFYIPGGIADDWRSAHPDSTVDGGTPTNSNQRGREWEYPAHIEFFESGGEKVLEKEIGLRIHGGWSRNAPRKSLRLYARSEYDQENTFSYPFFPELTATGSPGLPIDSFRRLILRNSGNDSGETLIRDAMIHELLGPVPIDTQAYRPLVHFINGEYWGLINLRERLDRHYLASHYGVDPDDVVILTNNSELKTGTEDDRQSYLALLDFATANDLAVAEAYEYLSTLVDMENLATYYAIQIYIGNTDWPQNNVDFWRKRTAHYNPQAPAGHDGRWRWLIYDLDFGFEIDEVGHNTIARLRYLRKEPGFEWAPLLFLELLENPTFRRLFINALADLKNTVFEPEYALGRIDAITARIEPYRDEHGERWGSGMDRGSGFTEFAKLRPDHVRRHILETFELSGTAEVTLALVNTKGGHLQLNSLTIGKDLPGGPEEEGADTWRGTYFKGVPITLKAIPDAGYRFTGWNGTAERSPELTLELTGDVSLSPKFERDEGALAGLTPPPHRLAEGPYVFSFWHPASPAGSYPPHMVFEQTWWKDAPAKAELTSLWPLSYDRTIRSRINGLGERGLSFINTANSQEEAEAGYPGSALLALDTRGQRDIRVTWTGGTCTVNDRIYGLRLQYRVGNSGPFHDLLGANGQPVEYIRNDLAGHREIIGPTLLPSELEEKPYVQLRWKYHYISGNSGPRAQLRLDNIAVISGPPDEATAPLYEIWKRAAFPDPETRDNIDIAGPTAEPHGDGAPNLLRYALGIPLSKDPSRLPRTDFNDGRLSLTFFRDPAKADLAYVVEATSDLLNWNEVLYDSRINRQENTDGNFMRITDAIPRLPMSPSRFLRLRIELLD